MIEDSHAAIVTPEEFEQAQKVIIDRIEVFNDKRVKIHFTFEDVLAGYAE